MVRSSFLALILLAFSTLAAQEFDPLEVLNNSSSAADSVAVSDSLSVSPDSEQDWGELYPAQIDIPKVEKEEVLLWIEQKRAAEMRD
ncbi:MAG TPA: hypothetical protein PLX77_06060, partial [Candidatus Cloacimonadota bacterium]|nr:hypothetical protein [Candidatus Cloacimonadota bacterium]